MRTELINAAKYFFLQAQFDVLQANSTEPNIFADPRVLNAAIRSGFDPHKVVVALVWSDFSELLACWPLHETSLRGFKILSTGFHEYMVLGAPVLKAGYEQEAYAALLGAISARADLPDLLLVPQCQGDGIMAQAMEAALDQCRFKAKTLHRSTRGALQAREQGAEGFLDTVFSAQKRKKLRQQYRRLEEQGSLSYGVSSGAQAAAALKEFLQLEHKGWKGGNGTSILSHEKDRVFIESLVQNLSAFEQVFISHLSFQAKMIAAGLILRSLGHVWFLKIAYDEAYKGASPGVHYANALVESLLNDPSFVRADSCAPLYGGNHVAHCNAPLQMRSVLISFKKGFDPKLFLLGSVERTLLTIKGIIKKILRR